MRIAAFSEALRIGCTVETDEGNPRLKAGLQRFEVLKQFSPRSHNYNASREYDVLICTDADGVGVNLQDADTVVNYDPPEGADERFQRAGRVLRITANSERVVQFYTLVPLIIDQTDSLSRVQNDICKRFTRITHRHNKSKRILGSGVISEEEHSEITLDSDLDVEQLTRDSQFLKDIGGLGAESMMSHVAVLEQYRSRAEELPEYLLVLTIYLSPIIVLVRWSEDQRNIYLKFKPM